MPKRSRRWTPAELERFQRKNSNRSNNPIRATHMEQDSMDEQTGQNKDNQVPQKYRINVHRYSAKLCDPDNIASKWSIDALEQAGIIPEDSPEYITAVTFEQSKCKRAEEKTVITLYQI